jgi:aminoglycoside phosphotransferase
VVEVTPTTAATQTLTDLVETAAGRVVCVSMSKDPNAKVTVLLFRPGESAPAQVAKVPTTDLAAASVEAEAAVLRALRCIELGPLADTVPELLAVADDGGRPVLVTTALPGRQMLAAYHTWRHTARPRAVRADFAAAGSWLAELAQRTSSGHADLATMLEGTGEVIERRFAGDRAVAADLESLSDLRGRLAGHLVPKVAVHHDFWPGNLLVAGGRLCGVIDWESARLGGLAVRDLAHFAITYSLYLDRHTRPGRRVPGHPALRAGVWGAGLDYAVTGTGWYPALVGQFVVDGLERLGVPGSLARAVLLAEIACIAAEADHPQFAMNTLLAYRRLSRAMS